MAKFVLAGKADCPNYAKAELLADFLEKNLPNFHVHKICQLQKDWQDWLEMTCQKNNWEHANSPIVWRELIDRGGKGILLGGLSEFLAHVQEYYAITSAMTAELMEKVAAENLYMAEQYAMDKLHHHNLVQPLNIWITSSLSPICYNLIPLLFDHEVFRNTPTISLHLLDVVGSTEALEDLKLEAEDMALPQLHKVTIHTGLEEAFHNAHIVVTLDDPELSVRKIAERFQKYGQLIDMRAHKGVRVIVAGNSLINLKCSVLQENAPSLTNHQFVAMATQVEKVAAAHIAKKLNVKTSDVIDVIVWGNISGSCHIDLQRARVFQYDGAIWGPPGFSQPVLEVLHDRKWLEDDFLGLVSSHHATVTEKTKRNTGLSAANGIITLLRAWNNDSAPGEVLSVGVLSTGQFDIPSGLVFSMPVKFRGGTWEMLPDIAIDDQLKTKLQVAVCQITEERELCEDKAIT